MIQQRLIWDHTFILSDNFKISRKLFRGLLHRQSQERTSWRNPIPSSSHNWDKESCRKLINPPVEWVVECTTCLIIQFSEETRTLRSYRLYMMPQLTKSTEGSFNQHLLKGWKFDYKVLDHDLLLRFCTYIYTIAVTVDIVKAFLMISVAKEDRGALHFLIVSNRCSFVTQPDSTFEILPSGGWSIYHSSTFSWTLQCKTTWTITRHLIQSWFGTSQNVCTWMMSSVGIAAERGILRYIREVQ